MTKSFTYTTQAGNAVPITLYGADQFGTQPCLVYIHGFKGFKDWGFVPYAGEYFANNGMSFLSFNFSHNGIGKEMLEFTELDKFERNTFSLELSEVNELVQLASHTDFFGDNLRHPLGLIGHSRGGGIALLAASKLPDVSAVATWAAVSAFDRFDKKTKQEWRKSGYHEVINSRTGQVLKMGMPMLEDIERHGRTTLHILNAVRDMQKPMLVLHGQNDETVPFFEAEQLNIYGPPALVNLRLIPNTGHTFGAKHPFAGTNEALEEALDMTLDFFRENLQEA